jgi:hypothetical protein
MTRLLGKGWPANSAVVLVALVAIGCAAPPAPTVGGTAACDAGSVHATLLAPGTFSASSARGVMLYATEGVKLATTSAAACSLERPTGIQVVTSSGTVDVGSLTGVPSRVNIRSTIPVTLELGSPIGCSHFSPPVWASSVTLAFPDGTAFRLGGMHMDVSCGSPIVLRF